MKVGNFLGCSNPAVESGSPDYIPGMNELTYLEWARSRCYMGDLVEFTTALIGLTVCVNLNSYEVQVLFVSRC